MHPFESPDFFTIYNLSTYQPSETKYSPALPSVFVAGGDPYAAAGWHDMLSYDTQRHISRSSWHRPEKQGEQGGEIRVTVRKTTAASI